MTSTGEIRGEALPGVAAPAEAAREAAIPLLAYDDDLDAHSDAPGWDVLTAAVDAAWGRESQNVGYQPGLGLGSGLAGASAHYRSADEAGGESAGYWSFITYGLSELWVKHPSGHPLWSGWGYELTLRVACSDESAPQWAYALLEQIARSSRNAGVVLRAGQHLALERVLTDDEGAVLDVAGIALREDGELGCIETPNGWVRPLECVLLDEVDLLRCEMEGAEQVLADLCGAPVGA